VRGAAARPREPGTVARAAQAHQRAPSVRACPAMPLIRIRQSPTETIDAVEDGLRRGQHFFVERIERS